MTPEQVAARVRDVRAAQMDDERAQVLEDELHQDVLEAIANGACSDTKACAAEALKTRDLDFARW